MGADELPSYRRAGGTTGQPLKSGDAHRLDCRVCPAGGVHGIRQRGVAVTKRIRLFPDFRAESQEFPVLPLSPFDVINNTS
jgi:hypothetical protein